MASTDVQKILAEYEAENTIAAALIVRRAWGALASETPKVAVQAVKAVVSCNRNIDQARLRKVLEKTTAQEVADSENPVELIASLYNSRLKKGRIATRL